MIITIARRKYGLLLPVLFLLASCSLEKKIGRSANENVLGDPALKTAHVGISVFEPASNKYWFNYQGDHYFVPASNTKLPTCYAAMKYLGDSLVAARVIDSDAEIFLYPAADPSLLHPDYPDQPLIRFLQSQKKKIFIAGNDWKEDGLGSGWSWNDYNDDYMAERSPMPVYGNVIHWVQERGDVPDSTVVYSVPDVAWDVDFNVTEHPRNFSVLRSLGANHFVITQGKEKFKTTDVPFITAGINSALELLPDTVGGAVTALSDKKAAETRNANKGHLRVIHSQPTDSLLSPMMHRSDNFFAEQSLLMVSHERLGVMNDDKIIDTLLKTDLSDLPQKPRWVDGSGLSRYNLFTPQDFVAILGKMKNEFGMDRIKKILPTGGTGTLGSLYKNESGFIFAKTGTLSGVVALSGFLYTKKNKLLIFSVLVNNHQASSTAVRKAVEKFITGLRESY